MYKTKYLRVNPQKPDPLLIKQAAAMIKAGELVAFPTETVYGLGADALQAGAAEKIFIAKGRPAEQPLLVHISRMEQVESLAAEIPDLARKLMRQFWPGPLSIILPAGPLVPEIVRGGKRGVGFRMPSHPVSIALINETGPIAAPSANLYGRPSPTSAEHVRLDLDGRIAAVLDAGATGAGLESTIIDLSRGCKILRRGGVALADIEAVLGQPLMLADGMTLRNPAYDLKVEVILCENEEEFIRQAQKLQTAGKTIGLVHVEGSNKHESIDYAIEYKLDLTGQGESFFAILRDAEIKNLDTLLIEPVDHLTDGIADAIVDRMRRAQKQ